MFSPLSNPFGKLFYNFTTSAPPASYLALSPFELHREPLMILGIADGKEYEIPGEEDGQPTEHGRSGDPEREAIRSELKPVVELLREQYPKALVHNMLIFDSSFDSEQPWHPEGTVQVPPLERSKMTTLKTLMCDLSAVLLGEMATLAKSFQALPEIHLTSTPANQSFAPRTPYDLTRQFSSSPFSPISESRSSTPTQGENARFSVPSQLHSSRTPTPTLQDASSAASTMGACISSPGAEGDEVLVDSKPQPHNRFSMSGFGSGSSAERQKLKEAAQQLVVNANITLMAGKLKETIHDLEIAASKAKDAGDNAFLAKALELMLVCFLLCAVQGVPFQIPAICFSGLRTSSLEGSLPALLELIPRLCETITTYYRRTLPTLPFAEWTLRYIRLVFIVTQIGSIETPESARDALAGFLENVVSKLDKPVLGKNSKDIADTLLRGMQPILEAHSSVEDAERIELLAETARCLSILGFEKKQAFTTKTLVDSLVPALIKARKAGAAEAGIHPAASLIGMGKQSYEKSLSADDNTLFLDHLGHLYGISTRGQDKIYGPVKYLKTSGSFPLKCDVLRSCIDVSEAMGEFKGVLKFTATLLHLGGPHMPLNPTDPRFRSQLSREEQIRLAGTIIRTVEAAHYAGFGELEAEYWDEYLLRDVSRSRVPGNRTLVSHQMSDIDESIEAEHKHGPFLHNAFASRAHDDIPETPVVVGEMAELFVTLQNPFEFDVEIESLRLVFNEDIVDTIHPLRAVLRSRGLHRFLVEWYPEKEGSLMLTGCSIKIRGCRERLFQVFTEVHESPDESNVKPNVTVVKVAAETKPTAMSIPTHVIEKQPSVEMHISLKQSALSLMEGETKVFTVLLEHARGSRKTPAKFIRMSLQNTVTDALEKRMSNKKLALTDWHYLDAARRNSVWRCSSGDDRFDKLSARGRRDWAVALFDIQVKGTRDLTGGTVILDYASTTPPPVLKDRYITSRVSKAVDVTVEPSVVMSHLNVVTGKDVPSYVKLAFPDDSPSDFFVVFCRYRNDSSKTMSVRMQPFVPTSAEETPSGNAVENGEVQREVSIHPEELIVQPGQTSICRQVVRRIFLPRSQQPVPEAQGRQYIYDGSVRSALEEQQGRETFWYRVELLNRLRATWTEVTSALPGGRTGEVTRPTVDVTPEMVAAMKHETVLLTTEVANIDGESILQDGPASYRVARNSRVRLNITITNPTGHEIRGTIRLKPKFDDPTVDVPDIRKQLDRRVPSFVLGPDATITKATEFWAMVVGVSMMLDVVFYEEGNVMRTYKSASCMVSFF
ncbi:hypothetical protein K490DRAFT_67370 [Saccharata proteae CBS 121410]|uniref:Hypercellular protein-like protein HypA n=1 Tax=Saccharata proteae CBS 121410 TaxID=1314787 RepID=A0A9P4HTL3_9PEZI|nr:hypothetical protein K490DRAFT_67370 [Saccharata proteae CBS 121410]